MSQNPSLRFNFEFEMPASSQRSTHPAKKKLSKLKDVFKKIYHHSLGPSIFFNPPPPPSPWPSQVSNLNRQFLFRRVHVDRPKSVREAERILNRERLSMKDCTNWWLCRVIWENHYMKDNESCNTCWLQIVFFGDDGVTAFKALCLFPFDLAASNIGYVICIKRNFSGLSWP